MKLFKVFPITLTICVVEVQAPPRASTAQKATSGSEIPGSNGMNLGDLMGWEWDGYPKMTRSRDWDLENHNFMINHHKSSINRPCSTCQITGDQESFWRHLITTEPCNVAGMLVAVTMPEQPNFSAQRIILIYPERSLARRLTDQNAVSNNHDYKYINI